MTNKMDPSTPRAFAGDEVFFSKADGPASGKVVCAGRHGCTVEHQGKHHKVRWEQLLGHKKRAVQRYHVEEHGEEGLIVRDGTGKRHFVGVPAEARAERLELAKSKSR